MRLTQIVGFNPAGGNGSMYGTEKVEMLFKAAGAIPVGVTAALVGTDAAGQTVIAGTSALGNLVVGLYEGVGGTGTATTVSGLSGNAAVSGDLISLTVYGKGVAIMGPQTSSNLSTGGKILNLGATAGQLQENTTPTATGFIGWPFVSLAVGATTAAATAATALFVRLI